jgi:flavin reductase (DIM6/NTAB) family NADH-FMN oxidoreductase RutF
MNPKLYAVAIYKGTKTLENALSSQEAVLQLLTKQQTPLVRTLGKKSGKKINKQSYLEKKGLLKEIKGFNVLKDCAAMLILEKQSVTCTGDHHLFIYKVKSHSTFTEENVLHFQDLIDLKIIL